MYLGEHVYLHTQAAIKIVQTRLTQHSLASFLQEAQTIAGLTHPNSIQVLDFGVEDAPPFLVMAYAAHGTLRQATRHWRMVQAPLSRLNLSMLGRRFRRTQRSPSPRYPVRLTPWSQLRSGSG